MSKARSVSKEWEFVSKGTETSLGKFVLEHLTPLTLDVQTGVVSAEDTAEIWEAAKEDAIEKVRGNKNRATWADAPMVDEKEVEKSFWPSRRSFLRLSLSLPFSLSHSISLILVSPPLVIVKEALAKFIVDNICLLAYVIGIFVCSVYLCV